MKVKTKAYGEVELDALDEALFTAVTQSDAVRDAVAGTDKTVTVEQVADSLMGRYGVPSDSFYGAWDNEVSRLADLFNEGD